MTEGESRKENGGKPKQTTGLRRVWKAFFHSLDGLKATLQYEAAFREEAVLASVLIPIALLLPLEVSMKAMMVGSVMLVLIVEILNSAVEAVVDRVSFEYHPISKRAKDMGSAAVFLSLLNVFTIWTLGLWDWLQI